MPSETEKIIIHSLNTIYEELGIKEDISTDTIIYGTDTGINSLSLVRLIVDVEEAVLFTLGKSIVLADERSLSLKNSPFYSVKTLAEFVNTLINEPG